MYSQEVKERAYILDPECWVSYSGKTVEHKRAMELRRTASLGKAQELSELEDQVCESLRHNVGEFRKWMAEHHPEYPF